MGASLLSLIVVLSIVVPLVSAPASDSVAAPLQAPSLSHPFGTDAIGRDVFVRTFKGGRVDLLIATVVVGASLAIGTGLGVLSGATQRRWVDAAFMRLVDGVIAFPFIVLVLAITVVLPPSVAIGPLPGGSVSIIIAIVSVNWSVYARLARGQALTLSHREYVLAARLLGYSQARIIRRHILPGVIRIVAAYAAADAILVVITTASLSFLGAGIQPPTPEWGSIMYDGRGLLAAAWWLSVLPGVVVGLTGLALVTIADATGGRRSGWNARAAS